MVQAGPGWAKTRSASARGNACLHPVRRYVRFSIQDDSLQRYFSSRLHFRDQAIRSQEVRACLEPRASLPTRASMAWPSSLVGSAISSTSTVAAYDRMQSTISALVQLSAAAEAGEFQVSKTRIQMLMKKVPVRVPSGCNSELRDAVNVQVKQINEAASRVYTWSCVAHDVAMHRSVACEV